MSFESFSSCWLSSFKVLNWFSGICAFCWWLVFLLCKWFAIHNLFILCLLISIQRAHSNVSYAVRPRLVLAVDCGEEVHAERDVISGAILINRVQVQIRNGCGGFMPTSGEFERSIGFMPFHATTLSSFPSFIVYLSSYSSAFGALSSDIMHFKILIWNIYGNRTCSCCLWCS